MRSTLAIAALVSWFPEILLYTGIHEAYHSQGSANLLRRAFGGKDGYMRNGPLVFLLCRVEYLGVSRAVADFGPIPRPSAKREMNIDHQVPVKACHMQATAETIINISNCAVYS